MKETKTSFPSSQDPTRELYPEARWSHCIRLPSSFFKIHFNIIPIRLCLQSDPFNLDFSTKFRMQCFPHVRCTCLLLSTFLTWSHQWLFFEGRDVCSSSFHSFLLLRIWLWNVMQTSCKLCCVVRFFKSYCNCLAVHLRRFMLNRVLSEQLGVRMARKGVRCGVPQCPEQFSNEIYTYVAKTTWIMCLGSCAWQAHSNVSATIGYDSGGKSEIL
jgi:hypothetical protein